MFCIKVCGKVYINNCQQLSGLSKCHVLKEVIRAWAQTQLFQLGNACIEILPTERVNLTLKGRKIQLQGLHVGTKD